jgi:hypothetical protein
MLSYMHVLTIEKTGQDAQWRKPAAWEKKDNSLPGTEAHVGEGHQGGMAGGDVQQPIGHGAPMAQ